MRLRVAPARPKTLQVRRRSGRLLVRGGQLGLDRLVRVPQDDVVRDVLERGCAVVGEGDRVRQLDAGLRGLAVVAPGRRGHHALRGSRQVGGVGVGVAARQPEHDGRRQRGGRAGARHPAAALRSSRLPFLCYAA